jgi:hypothetical protein
MKSLANKVLLAIFITSCLAAFIFIARAGAAVH